MALDWFGGLVGYDASNMKLGMVYEVSPHGELMYRTERWEKAQGSYESSVQVKRDSCTPAMSESGLLCSPVVLKVSGNPVKFLQGHNAFGPEVGYTGSVLQAFARALPGELRPLNADDGRYPAVHMSRVDINVMVDLGNHDMVHNWLQHAGSSTRSRHGRPQVSGDTTYWGKHSRRWTMKAYCKFCELAAHPPADLELYRLAREFVEPQLRLELTLRGSEIKTKDSLHESLVWEYMEKIEVGVMDADFAKKRPNLKPAVENVLTLWLAGNDVRHRLPRRTFYHYRRLILEAAGVDISLAPNEQGEAIERVKFDLDYLKAHELKAIPDYLQGWLFRP